MTDRCNLRCRYCMPEAGVEKKLHSDILRIEEIKEIVRISSELGIEKIRITGGEPLIRRGIVSLCESISEMPKVKELALTTNGQLLPEMAKDLADAGVDRVNISLDTLRPERYRQMTRTGDIDRVLDGIEAAQKAGLTPIKINTVLIGGYNEDEVDDFIKITTDNDIHVRFIELMPLGVAVELGKSAFTDAVGITDRHPEPIPLGNDGVARIYRLPGAKGTIGLITPMSHEFCDRCDKLRLTSDGKLKPCLHSDKEIPLKGLSGDKLCEAIKEAITLKPLKHPDYIPGEATAGGRYMNKIGG